jgi:hypothetical protein
VTIASSSSSTKGDDKEFEYASNVDATSTTASTQI